MSKASTALKSLQTQLTKLKDEIGFFKKERSDIDAKIKTHEQKVSTITKQINELKTTDVIVSEHAIIRYLERKYQLDSQSLIDEILTVNNRTLIEFSKGNCKIKSGEIEFLVKNNVVITVLDR